MRYSIQAPSQLASHLRALRKSKGLSQLDLGKRLGLSQARIARIEGDPLSISVEQLLRVLGALGVRVDLDDLQAIVGSASIAEGAAIVQGVGAVNAPSTDPTRSSKNSSKNSSNNDEAW
jgi:HTH-type transcriptional regulator/antitoxin HipB